MRWRVKGVDLGAGRGTRRSSLALRSRWAAQRANSIESDTATPVRRSRNGVAAPEGGEAKGRMERTRGTTLEVCN